jgi:Flp pilus assembly protein TadD
MARNRKNRLPIATDATRPLPAGAPASGSLRTLAPVLGLIFLSGIAYHNSLRAPFIFDDTMNIRTNAALRRLWPLWHTLWGPHGSGVAGRPAPQLSFAIDYAFWGFNPLGYHISALILHTLTALVLFGVVRRTLLLPNVVERFGARGATALAFVAAAVWVTHPLLADSVTYLASRSEQLVGLFCLTTMYATIRGATFDRPGRSPWGWYAVAVVACALATCSKEVAATTPLLVVLYDRVFLSSSWRQVARQRSGLYVGLVATLALVPLNLYMAGFHRVAMQGRPHLTPWDYLKIQAPVLMHYLRLTVWPDALVLDYQGWLKFHGVADVWRAGLALSVLFAVTVWGVLWRRSAAAYCAAWCFIALAPTSSVLPIPTEVGTARRMYLPLMALAALATVAAWRLMRLALSRVRVSARGAERMAALLAAVLLVVMVNRTLARNEDFNNPVSLWAVTVERQPDNPRAWQQLAIELRRAGNDDAAVQAYLRCIALSPDNETALNNLATIYIERGDDAAATQLLRAAAHAEPNLAAPLNNLSAIALRQGDVGEAERLAREAVARDPQRAASRIALASALNARRAFAEAGGEARAAQRMDPESAAARLQLGRALAGLGGLAGAAAAYRTAMEIDPGSPAPRLWLAWLLASAPSGSGQHDAGQAIQLAAGVVEETRHQDSSALDVLALALAADGQFSAAADTAGRAIELARVRQPNRVAAIEARRAAYLGGRFPEASALDFGA